MSKAVFRFSGLGIEGGEQADDVQLHVFMNMLYADHSTSLDESRHIATFSFKWEEKPETRIQQITYKHKTLSGMGTPFYCGI